ncbi:MULTISPECIES: protein-glutamate O-methyltransferase CheR [unclassified Nocardioides]|uniref:CheR family methyltransferase n=1 Tax=unclassified Nocardioides TaxID=2615069 RepID=UPI002665B07B|nr:protein-glutamate O-methyltransferase CheR [Nocardioides sp. Arc9.136]WKN47633.1 protein-glutamate O-methyltransferase CheR [Nocardioides sp. Arc9.136]
MSISPRTFGFVADLVRSESAIVLAAGKEYLVESRLLPLARAGGHADVDAYVGDLERRRTPAAVRAVVEALTTNETSWFRDSEPFTALKQVVLPELAARRAGRPIRVWCAACSSGQEPYSVSMVVQDTPAVAQHRVEIVATDLSEEMVQRARTGEYSQLEVNRGLPATTLVRYFQRAGVGWRVDPQVAARVSFRTLNLVRPFPPMGGFDVVMLRNVLIYFDLATKRDILRRVSRVLAPDGYLFLGAAEMTTGVDDSWERVPAGRSSIYRPKPATRSGVA